MIIIEPDFKIVKQDSHYVLYVIKSKKELREDNSDNFKPRGYFIELSAAIKSAYLFRKDKKYKGSESSTQLLLTYKKLKHLEDKFIKSINEIYNPIKKYKSTLPYDYSKTI